MLDVWTFMNYHLSQITNIKTFIDSEKVADIAEIEASAGRIDSKISAEFDSLMG